MVVGGVYENKYYHLHRYTIDYASSFNYLAGVGPWLSWACGEGVTIWRRPAGGGDTSDLQMSAQLVLGYCDYGLFRVRCGDVSPHLTIFWLL